MSFEAVIGLEVHAQLATKTKLFCGCPTRFGDAPNTHVCPVCFGLPGALPMPNREAVAMAIATGLALGCTIRRRSVFARKSYFYPDLAKGYQITQFELPIDEAGQLPVEVEGQTKVAGITRIHLEEDAAKNLHGVGDETLVDFNRAGVPLIEIVGEPDLRSGAEAEAYLRALREVLVFLGVSDGNLEEGSFRCDANVSLRPVGSAAFGTRVELKNINSFRFVRKALEFEIARQEALLAAGGEVASETRTWVEGQGRTVAMRAKEESQDYRYFPDPDLPPLVVDDAWVEEIRRTLPELPEAVRARWVSRGLTEADAKVLSAHPALVAYFDAAVGGGSAKATANFIQSEVLGHVVLRGLQARFPVPPEHLRALLALVAEGTINRKIAKEVFAKMRETSEPPDVIVEREGLAQLSDEGAIEAAVRQVLTEHPSQVEQFRSGKTAVLGYLVGQVMKATRGQANPRLVNEILRRLLRAS